MKKTELRDYFRQGRILVAAETYAIVKSRRACADAFAVVRDANEVSSVVEESRLRSRYVLGLEGDWRRMRGAVSRQHSPSLRHARPAVVRNQFG